MIIQPINPILTSNLSTVLASNQPGHAPSFESVLGQAVQGLTNVENQANAQAVNLATGQGANLVDSMLAMEQMSLNFKLAMQVRDKVIEAYQTVMQTQV
jgi:flagellar hook-basal body complex protein FliE